MITNLNNFVNKSFGSSFELPANGLGGSRATSISVAHFASQNTASNPAEKNRAKPEKQKGKKEGGLGEGIFALLRIKIERFRFSLIKRNTKQKNFLFLLKEKIAREKIKKCRENLSVLVPPKRSEGGRKRTSFLFGIFFEKSSDFVQNTEPDLKTAEKANFFINKKRTG